MVRFHIVACVLILPNIFGTGYARRSGFLGKYDVIHEQLKEYIAEHRPARARAFDGQSRWFEQKLDHFSPANTETWQQQYTVSTDYDEGNSLVFLLIEGEGPMDPEYLPYYSMSKFAKKYGATEFCVEHRFYGKSKPKPDLSLDSLRYLSSDQALADLAYFITEMNAQYGFKNPKWIVFGGSYAGSLAAWLRYKYPHLVYAAVSSSAPLDAKADFPEYLQVVTKSLATVNPACPDAIKSAIKEMSKNAADPKKREEYGKMFGRCESTNDLEDLISLFDDITGIVGGSVQYNRDIATICDVMTDKKIKNPVKRFAHLYRKFGDEDDKGCFGKTYEEKLKGLTDTSRPQEDDIYRQWIYQTCTEFGWYQTSNNKNDTFGNIIPLEYFTDLCAAVFGPKFDELFINRSTQETNMNYGGKNIVVERVIFVHGSLDPWSPLGIMSNPPQGSYAIVIKGASHCEDMIIGKNSTQVAKARTKISEIIGNWLSGKPRRMRRGFIHHF